jgi:CheY-like chemotaxis protein
VLHVDTHRNEGEDTMDYTATFAEEPERQVKAILVVEDDAALGEFFIDALKEEISFQALLEKQTSFQARLATDGFQALETVKTLIPHLFILDYHLPKMNGFELYDHLQATAELKNIPTLLMSANLPIREHEKRRVYFIKKPFELEELLQTIKKILAA